MPESNRKDWMDLEDRGWEQMERLLEQELPQRKRRRPLFIWWMFGLALLAGSLVSYKLWYTGASRAPLSKELSVRSTEQVSGEERGGIAARKMTTDEAKNRKQDASQKAEKRSSERGSPEVKQITEVTDSDSLGDVLGQELEEGQKKNNSENILNEYDEILTDNNATPRKLLESNKSALQAPLVKSTGLRVDEQENPARQHLRDQASPTLLQTDAPKNQREAKEPMAIAGQDEAVSLLLSPVLLGALDLPEREVPGIEPVLESRGKFYWDAELTLLANRNRKPGGSLALGLNRTFRKGWTGRFSISGLKVNQCYRYDYEVVRQVEVPAETIDSQFPSGAYELRDSVFQESARLSGNRWYMGFQLEGRKQFYGGWAAYAGVGLRAYIHPINKQNDRADYLGNAGLVPDALGSQRFLNNTSPLALREAADYAIALPDLTLTSFVGLEYALSRNWYARVHYSYQWIDPAEVKDNCRSEVGLGLRWRW